LSAGTTYFWLTLDPHKLAQNGRTVGVSAFPSASAFSFSGSVTLSGTDPMPAGGTMSITARPVPTYSGGVCSDVASITLNNAGSGFTPHGNASVNSGFTNTVPLVQFFDPATLQQDKSALSR
jgi:hypothetical protein